MNLRDFRQAGHWPTLLCAFLYFDVSFMVWVLLGALANSLAADFPVSPFALSVLVALPILSGAVLRLILGHLADHVGARRTALLGMVLTILPLLLGWLWVDHFSKLLLVGLLLGVAGASFAVALPLASSWYPPRYQGLALSIAGAGNSGTALATLFGPPLAEWYGWHAVLGLALLPLLAVLGLFVCCARESPNSKAPARTLADYRAILRLRDTLQLCLFYALTFGGFVGLACFLNIYFYRHHDLSRIGASMMATICVIVGSLLRPVGSYLADRLGGISLLTLLFVLIGILLLDLATSPPLIWGTVVLVLLMALFGLGNGAVFQLVPQRFPRDMGLVTRVVGACGALGGALVLVLLGGADQLLGSYSLGFVLLALVAFSCVAGLVRNSQAWEETYLAEQRLS